jgi:hypothetical protein
MDKTNCIFYFRYLTILLVIYAGKKKLFGKETATTVSVGIVIGIVLIGWSCVDSVKAINPKYETVNVTYVYQSSNGVVFGREYNFKDADDKVYSLTMDPITHRKIFYGKDFDKEKHYSITYEDKTDTIVGIEELK